MGGNQNIHVDIRVIAASKRNLKLEVERGKFREDLFFRLAVVPIELPPLRERREDIPLLVETLLASMAAADPETPTRVSAATLDALRAHDWPGNVRELRNVLERAAYMARATGRREVDLSMMPFAGSPPPPRARTPRSPPSRRARATATPRPSGRPSSRSATWPGCSSRTRATSPPPHAPRTWTASTSTSSPCATACTPASDDARRR
ncbi:MAG: sigma 54-interacting transcriptional regulator [Sandaracinaceae bacterium]|nr:sigma 54-interacting transcriptional regulator [Sandaracinaceae bacterium]